MGKAGSLSDATDGFTYDFHHVGDDTLNLPPSYDQFLSWAADAERKSLAYDIWARGNYVRFLKQTSDEPTLLVPFRFLDELRCYYRRISLLGLRAQYLYVGELPTPRQYMCPHPADDNYMIDAGAGWIAALGSQAYVRGRKWFPIIGYSQPMPEVFVEWLVNEGEADFAAGRAMLAPSSLVGIPTTEFDSGMELLADVSGSESINPTIDATELMLGLDLPYVDEMDDATFKKIIQDNDHRLSRFRYSIRKLIETKYSNIEEVIDELKNEIAEICVADGGMRFRQTIAKFGGVFTTFGVGISAYGTATASGNSPLSTAALAAGGAVAGASAALVDLWKQTGERRAKRNEHKFSLFWDMGVRAPCKLERKKSRFHFRKHVQPIPLIPRPSFQCHWLCPPAQMKFLAVRKIR